MKRMAWGAWWMVGMLSLGAVGACGDDGGEGPAAEANNDVNNDFPNNDVNNDVNNDANNDVNNDAPNNDAPNNDANNDVNNDPNNDLPDAGMEDGGALDADEPDVDEVEDGGVPDADEPDADEPPVMGEPGETCEGAPSLAAISQDIPTPPGRYHHRLEGAFGQSNDTNPFQEAGLPPGCSLVFDARGNDVVVAVTLSPGATLHTRLELEPVSAIPALYMVDGCPVTGWPDVDESGLCGNNEYFTEGFCLGGFCAPLEWSFTWPESIGGQATVTTTFFLVLDEVGGASAERFALEWAIVE